MNNEISGNASNSIETSAGQPIRPTATQPFLPRPGMQARPGPPPSGAIARPGPVIHGSSIRPGPPPAGLSLRPGPPPSGLNLRPGPPPTGLSLRPGPPPSGLNFRPGPPPAAAAFRPGPLPETTVGSGSAPNSFAQPPSSPAAMSVEPLPSVVPLNEPVQVPQAQQPAARPQYNDVPAAVFSTPRPPMPVRSQAVQAPFLSSAPAASMPMPPMSQMHSFQPPVPATIPFQPAHQSMRPPLQEHHALPAPPHTSPPTSSLRPPLPAQQGSVPLRPPMPMPTQQDGSAYMQPPMAMPQTQVPAPPLSQILSRPQMPSVPPMPQIPLRPPMPPVPQMSPVPQMPPVPQMQMSARPQMAPLSTSQIPPVPQTQTQTLGGYGPLSPNLPVAPIKSPGPVVYSAPSTVPMAMPHLQGHPVQQPLATNPNPSFIPRGPAPMDSVPSQMSQSQPYQQSIVGPNSVALVGANTAVADVFNSDFGFSGRLQPNIDNRFLQCTMNKFPRTAAQLAKTRLPFGVTITFYPADSDVSDPALQVPRITGPIVRCGRCRTYLNPAVEIVEAGMRWRCNLCFLTNNFPPGYDPTAGPDVHPELHSFVYDFANAPVEYTVRPPMPPIFVFILDVTASAVLSGFTATALRVIQEELDSIPNDDGRTRIAFITIDASLHFFQVRAASEGKESTAAKLLVVSDAAEPFLPAAPSDLLLTVADCRAQIEDLLTSIPRLFDPPSPSPPSFGPALRAAHSLLKGSGGKIVSFLASRPNRHEGALKDRNEAKLYNTPKETTLLAPESNFYKLFATESVKDQVSVDLFLAPPSQAYLDISTLSGLAKYTGGRLFYYPGFNAARSEDVEQFSGDLRRFLGLEHNWEAVLRIRASQGLSLAAYHGSFFLRQTDLLALPSVNPDNSYSAQLTVEENLVGNRASLQAALLHTTSHGERRIRVVNFVAPVTEDPRDLLLSASLPGIIGLLPKMAVEKIYGYNLQDSREAVKNKVIDVVSAYMGCLGIKPQSHHNAVLPDNLKLFPLVMLSLLKSPVLRGSNASGSPIPADYRAYYMTLFKTLSCDELCRHLLPSFLAIHSMDSACGLPDESDASKIVLPPLLTLSSERLERHGVFLLSTGMDDFLWVGSATHPELLKLLFGVESAMELPPPGRFTLPELDNDWSRRLQAIRAELHRRHLRHTTVPLYLVREEANLDVMLGSGMSLRSIFQNHLVEDRTGDIGPSYAQWIQEIGAKVAGAS